VPILAGMFERFTDRARRVVVYAQEEARILNHDYIGTEHILLGLIREGEGVAARTLASLDVSLPAARDRVQEIIGQGQHAPAGHIPFTPRAKKVLELALREALQMRHTYIGTGHILLGLIRERDGVAAQVLEQLGADIQRVRDAVLKLLEGHMAGAEVRKVSGEAGMAEAAREMARASETPADDVLSCPNCSSAIDETLAVKEIETSDGGGEPLTVKVAYCNRCGVVLGVLG
jgi:ATP-dependent Clp protease ATP-binding subunit ClpC